MLQTKEEDVKYDIFLIFTWTQGLDFIQIVFRDGTICFHVKILCQVRNLKMVTLKGKSDCSWEINILEKT